jgi:cobalt-zinc-cadmium efflux system membrane fusion protein
MPGKTIHNAVFAIKKPVMTLSALLCLMSMPGIFAGCAAKKPLEAPRPVIVANQITLSPEQERSIGLQLGTVQKVVLSDDVICSGQIQASSFLMTPVYAPAAGRAVSVPVTLGQFVRSGQLLATVKSDAVGQLQADLLQQTIQNEADYRQAKAQVSLSKAVYGRELELYKEQVEARADMEAARTQYEKDAENLSAIRSRNLANIQSAQERMGLFGVSPAAVASVLGHKRIMPFLAITAPRAGLVISRSVNPGEMADTSKELFTVADLSTVWLVGSVYEKDIPKVHLGQEATVTLDSVPGEEFGGKVNFVSEVLNPQTRTLDVRAEIPNPGLRLKPNMFARMSIRVGQQTVLAAPLSAIQKVGDYQFIYVAVAPHTFEERKITVGRQNNQYAEILSGAREGDSIAVNGTTGIKGALVIQISNMQDSAIQASPAGTPSGQSGAR